MSETTNYQATFDLIDVDHDGLISAAELKNLMAALGGEVSDEMAEHAVQVIDTDGDGLVSLPELADYLSENSSPQQ
ncbi:EF-hand domain-containing protein [Kineosporia sp. J2-2]|uniref:EF-hand domain-containing protein n=1 Tax=Kineosporia corallincola TaxID=2835133 RepID=A0ABS5TKM1_9ACTN|nr:EF-hand domain-containing protein [Kineosporia corallincola]MBT0770909.1 EF-hand domain-containing protein [Kineosporia corallincola]